MPGFLLSLPLMCLNNCAYTHGRSDENGLAYAAIPVSCMRTSGSQLICLCHLDEGGHSIPDAATLDSLSYCDPSELTTQVDTENDLLPPFSSSPPEIASSSPQSAIGSSYEEGSVNSSESSSPFNIPSPLGTELTKNSDCFPRWEKDLDLPENKLVKTRPACSPSRTPWSASSHTGSPDESLRGSAEFYANYSSAPDGKKGSPKTAVVPPHDSGLAPSPDSITEISPITFSANSEFQKLSPLYRLIKRARSYKHHLEEPLPKRTKIKYESTSDRTRRVYAPRAASLRRAESLTTISDVESSPQSGDLNVSPAKEVPPGPLRRWIAKEKVIPHPVPIIAPPENYVGGLLVSAESLAAIRVRKFLERELDLRAAEGFSADLLYSGLNTMISEMADAPVGLRPNSRSFWETALGIGRERRLKAINWLLNVKPVVSKDPDPVSAESPCSTSTVTPCSSSASSVTVGNPAEVVDNLLDQLQTSHETRFHACWMFLRYFYLVMSSESFRFPERVSCWPNRLDSSYRSKLEREGCELVTLDVSVACLSLSVKFHRDFLDPLFPVYAYKYLALSPHGMSYDDLETAHRDVLSAFRYRLGVSPQSLMDELWFALPSLRDLLCFERGWSYAMEHAWTVLFRAVCEADVQMFSVSLLTTVAVMNGIIQSLVHRYHFESTTDSPPGTNGSIINGSLPNPICSKTTCPDLPDEQARRDAKNVLCEMQALVGLTETQLRICRLWVEQFEEC